ncbi:MAG: VWA domain-containing protein [Kiritimatiellae bacterium]|nr:VWA domain-containing protein [Kiritimatiellia bacterium]
MNNNSVDPNKQFEELVESYIDGTITEEQSKALLELIQDNETNRKQFAAQVQLAELLAIKEGGEEPSVHDKILALLTASPAPGARKQPGKFNWSRTLVRIAAILMVAVGVSYVVKLNFEDQMVTSQEFALKETVVFVEPQALELEAPSEATVKPRADGSSAIDSTELKKDTEALIGQVIGGSDASHPASEREAVESPISPTPQEFNAVMTVKSPLILKNIDGSTRSTDNAPSRRRSVGTRGEQSAVDYRSEDLEVLDIPADQQKTEEAQPTGVAPKMVPLEIAKPKPQFSGTPKDIRSPNLESSSERLARQEGVAPTSSQLAPASRGAARYKKMIPPGRLPQPKGESYAKIEENEFLTPAEKPLSTFSIDVDTASYSNMRRFIMQNQLPPADAVRVEELINYFEYNYAAPGPGAPFSAAMALHPCPWNPQHHLLRVGLQGRKMDADNRKPSNLVFLLDVSGSMDTPDKLPLLKTGLAMLVNALTESDRVAIVVYAGSSGLVLDSTSAAEKEKIIAAMGRLTASGSTAGGAGIQLAYRVAADNFIKGGVNRVILATDGDFNVGVSSHNELQALIEQQRASGIFLSVLGFGTGNLQDSKMELLANKGNGNYFYIDTEREARKVLVEQLNATLVTIAKDVKIQIEFNPEYVKQYRLIGYENRKMAARDFDDDKKDAGEIGAGHQVTALYEIIPVGAPDMHDSVTLKYGKKDEKSAEPQSPEMLTLKLRYKEPEGENSQLLTFPLSRDALQRGAGDQSFRWAAAVAAFGQILRGSPHVGNYSFGDVKALAADAKGEDPNGYCSEFINLLERAAKLQGAAPATNDKGYPLWQYRN